MSRDLATPTSQTISHYRVMEEPGKRRHGCVYKADLELGRSLLALKFLPQYAAGDPQALERFRRGSNDAHLRSITLNICTIYEIGNHEAAAHRYEYLDGGDIKL